jgi:plasmid rolling circle replication initiator protein Rep
MALTLDPKQWQEGFDEASNLYLYLRDNSDLENVTKSQLDQHVSRNPRVEESEVGSAAEPEYLAESSPRDVPWDSHRADADEVARIYASHPEFNNLSGRVSQCSLLLGFAWAADPQDAHAQTLKLREARFCRVRHCPICQWRRSLMWLARFQQALPGLVKAHPTARFVFLTLTQKNVPVDALRAALRGMNKGWARLSERKVFDGGVLGWIRTTEVTRGKDGPGMAHPHFHVLLMVRSNYFSKHYVKQADWVTAWRKALRIDYDPVVDVRAVKTPKRIPAEVNVNGLLGAVRETLKYSVKPADMKAEVAWFLEITRQLRKLRFIASGGLLKDVLRPDDETEQELLLLREAEQSDERASVFFDWNRPVRRYKRQFNPEGIARFRAREIQQKVGL